MKDPKKTATPRLSWTDSAPECALTLGDMIAFGSVMLVAGATLGVLLCLCCR